MMLQMLVTVLLVLLCALYATWRLLAARHRLWLIGRLLAPGGRCPQWLAGWRDRALAQASRSCGACTGGARAKQYARRG